MATKKKPAKKVTEKQTSNRLVISTADKKSLSKNQLAFNKLTQRISKLHKEIEKKYLLFDNAIKHYANTIPPLRQEKAKYARTILDSLWAIYKEKKLPKADIRILKEMMQEQLRTVFSSLNKEPDEALKNIFRNLQGETYESYKRKENEYIKEEVEDMFGDYDIDIDLDDVEVNSEAMAEKIREAKQKLFEQQERAQQQHEHKQKHKKKSAKQQEKEKQQQEVDELKQKNISTIYKQLAKLFHPDLEQDENRRAEKEILMKELTTAYQAKNLHALLTLELKWIHKETDHLESLTEEKLNTYIQVLQEQAQELENEKYRISQLPRYSVLAEEFGHLATSNPLNAVERAQHELDQEVRQMQFDIQQLTSNNPIKYIKKMIQQYEDSLEHDYDFDDILEDLFGGRGGRY